MTKEKLISLVRRRLAGGNITPDLLGKYPNPVIEAYISTVMNSIFFDLFKNNSSLLDMFAKNYEASIDEYSSMNTHYSTLPASIVQLPNNAGIRLITAKQDNSFVIPLVDSRAKASFTHLDVGRLCLDMYAYLTGSEVFYENKRKDINSVLFKLIIPFTGYADTD